MTSKKCIDAEKLIRHKNSELPETESKVLREHLSTCELCRINLQILDRIDKTISLEETLIKDNGHKPQKSKTCLSEHQLYNYIEGHVTKTEAHRIGKHLSSCKYCLSELSSLARNSLTPMTDKEKTTVGELRTISIEEQADKILSFQEEVKRQASDKSEEMAVSWSSKVVEVITKIFNQFFIGESYSKPVFVSLILLVCIAGVYKGIKYYNTGYQINLAENKLLDNYQIFFKNARLSGGYKSTGVSMLMSSEEESESYLDQSKFNLNKAFNNKYESTKAKQLQAHIYFIEKEISSADSVFAQIEETEISTEILNDKGVLLFEKRDWENAINKFQQAFDKNPGLLEALYNSALCKIELGESTEAVSILKKYVALETDERWKSAAQSVIKDITAAEEE